MELTFEQGTEEFIAEALGLQIDNDGYFRTEDGEYAAVSDGREKLHRDNIGAFEYNEECPNDTLLVPDSFPEIVEHSKRMDEKDTDEEAASEAMEDFLEAVADSMDDTEHATARSPARVVGLVVGVALLVVLLVKGVRRLFR